MLKSIIKLIAYFGPLTVVGQQIRPVTPQQIFVGGELESRIQHNYKRLLDTIYSPSRVFAQQKPANSADWPGDVEGRLLLALVLEAQATHFESKNIQQIIDSIPKRLNAQGYFGPIQRDTITEQQLSGNGWYLRGLCEYYLWKKDLKTKTLIKNVIDNLALPTRGYHNVYPINPASRKKNVGAASGTTQATVGKWKLSSDIGCDFIFMDGVIQAYEVLPSKELKSLIDEMVSRFLQINLIAINAQTHATLTGLRGLLRYYKITKNTYLLREAIDRYNLYRTNAMTANYENFNWFGRPEWTEPCGIIDSYLIAVQLWQYTQDEKYIEDAQHIYYNAIANTQRYNGGFGLNNCPIPNTNSLKVDIDEAWWCCTMRGGEGLTKAAQYSYFQQSDTVIVPFYNSSDVKLTADKKSFVLKQRTDYPFISKVDFKVDSLKGSAFIDFKLAAPSWTKGHILTIDGVPTAFKLSKGFIIFKSSVKKGTKISLQFDMATSLSPYANMTYSKADYFTFNYGPMLLGMDTQSRPECTFNHIPGISRISRTQWGIDGTKIILTPVYHLLDSTVTKKSGYSKQILLKINHGK